MKEENKLRIQVRSKTEQRMMEDLEVKMITEWDVRKISVLILGLLILLLGISYYFMVNNTEDKLSKVTTKAAVATKIIAQKAAANKKPLERKPDLKKPIAAIENEKLAAKKVNKAMVISKPVEKAPIKNNKIKRAVLAQETINKEPLGVVNLPLRVNKKKAITVTYFTEVINMKGNSVRHEWVLNDKVIYSKKINVLGERWRISTRKLFSYTAIGKWQVRLLDDKGRVLHKIDFSVIK